MAANSALNTNAASTARCANHRLVKFVAKRCPANVNNISASSERVAVSPGLPNSESVQ